MLLSIILSLLVVLLWSYGDINYSKLSSKLDKINIYFYQYLIKSLIYLLFTIIFNISLFTNFNITHFLIFSPVIFCDLAASIAIYYAVSKGKLSIVSPIMAAYPIVTIYLGIVLLHEKPIFISILLSMIITVCIIILSRTSSKDTNHKSHKRSIIYAIIYMFLIAFSTYFEKDIYNNNLSIHELYYYKGLVYLLTSLGFLIVLLLKKDKIHKLNKDIIKGSILIPVGNVFYSLAISLGDIIYISPITSMYSILTNYLSVNILKEKLSITERISISLILLSTILLIIISL